MNVCFSCRNKDAEPGSFFCAECRARYEAAAEAKEALARSVECPSCPAAMGVACISGAGNERKIAHVTREKLARQAAEVRP